MKRYDSTQKTQLAFDAKVLPAAAAGNAGWVMRDSVTGWIFQSDGVTWTKLDPRSTIVRSTVAIGLSTDGILGKAVRHSSTGWALANDSTTNPEKLFAVGIVTKVVSSTVVEVTVSGRAVWANAVAGKVYSAGANGAWIEATDAGMAAAGFENILGHCFEAGYCVIVPRPGKLKGTGAELKTTTAVRPAPNATDLLLPTEKAVRDAVDAVASGALSAVKSVAVSEPLTIGSDTTTNVALGIRPVDTTADGYMLHADKVKLNGIAPGATNNTLALGETQDTAYRGDRGKTAYDERRQWDGSSTNLDAATGRTSLGLGTAAVVDTKTATALGNDNTGVPTQLAVKTYVDNRFAEHGTVFYPAGRDSGTAAIDSVAADSTSGPIDLNALFGTTGKSYHTIQAIIRMRHISTDRMYWDLAVERYIGTSWEEVIPLSNTGRTFVFETYKASLGVAAQVMATFCFLPCDVIRFVDRRDGGDGEIMANIVSGTF